MSRRHPGARSLGGLRPSLAFPRAASRALALLLVLALGSACTTSQGKPKPASPVPVPYQLIAHPVDRSTLSLVELRGYDLYVRDLAASRATNAALSEIAKHKFGEIAGWIVVPYEQGLLTRFLTRDGKSSIDVSVDPTSALPPYVVVNEPEKTLSDREAAMWRARELARHYAIEKPVASCSDRYETVVLPESVRDDSDWLVYLIAMPADPNRFAVGGHHRIRISADGARIVEHFPLSKGCLSPEYDPDSPGFVVTHLVSSEPVETEVYLSLLHGIRLYVSIPEPKQLFSIENGRIRRVED